MTAPRESPSTATDKRAPPRRALVRRPWFWLLILAIVALAWWALERDRRSGAASGPGASRPGASGATASAPRRGRGPPDRVMPVTVESAELADVPVVLDALGTVSSLRTVTVRSQVDGQLMKVYFREGQLVKAGDLLAEIDSRQFEVQLMQAQGQMTRDQSLLANAKRDLERYRTLVKKEAASEQQLDTQRALVQQYEGVVKSDQGQIDNVRLQLAYSKITAPISGRLGLRLIDAGNIVRAGDATGLVTITQIQPIGVTFSLPEKELSPVLERYRRGQPMVVEALDRDQRTVLGTGRLTTIDNQIDTATGTLKMKAEFANTDSALFPNQFVNVRVIVDTLANAVVVPSAAIQRGAPGIYVYVVQEDRTVALRKIVLGPVEGERTVVQSGVAAGEPVVIDGVDNLRNGIKVEPIARSVAERSAAQPPAPQRPAGAAGSRSR